MLACCLQTSVTVFVSCCVFVPFACIHGCDYLSVVTAPCLSAHLQFHGRVSVYLVLRRLRAKKQIALRSATRWLEAVQFLACIVYPEPFIQRPGWQSVFAHSSVQPRDQENDISQGQSVLCTPTGSQFKSCFKWKHFLFFS